MSLLCVLMALCVHLSAHAASDMARVRIEAAQFASTLPPSETEKIVHISAFEMDTIPVSNARFLDFVQKNLEWQAGQVAKIFADENYLSHWQGPVTLAANTENQPVVRVSWFAANAYCQEQGGRLPLWYEWELAAAAGQTVADARNNPEWRQQILNWYARSSAREQLPNVGETPANYYGIKDLHGVIWEWVEDFNGMLVGADNREQGGADKLKFCGAGAANMEQKENYATLMRVALLSSMQARFTTRNLGFRCAYDAVGVQK